MMSEMCIIEGCDGTEELLSFPTDPSTLQQWMLCLKGRLKHPVNSSSKVCSAHFTSDSLEYWQQKQSGVAGNLIVTTGDVGVYPWSQERTSVGGLCDLQQTLVIEDTGLSRSTPSYAQSRATQTPAVTHVSLGDGLDFLLHPAKVVAVQKDHCSVHTTVWASGFESNRNTSNIQGRNALVSDIVVKLACLLQLFQKCLKCCSDACSVSVSHKGPVLHVVQRCWSCGNTREWTSQPPSEQLPPDPTNSLKAKEELAMTSDDMEDEINFKIKEEGEEEVEQLEDEQVVKEEEVEEEKEETGDEAEIEEEKEEDGMEEEEKQKLKKRKRRENDAEWAPNDEAVMETSDEESEEEEENEEEEEVVGPHQCKWCCDCGEETSVDCFRQKHLQVYCCIKCGYRDGYQEPRNTEFQETQRSISETPSAGHQEGSGDVSQVTEGSCSPEDDGNNKPTASTYCPENPKSIISQGVITGTCQHATNSGNEEPLDNGVDASNCRRYDHSKGVCTREEWGTNQSHASVSQMESNNNLQQETIATNQDKQNIPIYAVYFKDLCSLQRHMRRSHSGKRHLCPDCGVFSNSRNRKNSHVCNHKVKPFPCPSCGRRFSSEARLQLHIQFHNEDYTTKCQYCYETFKQKEDKQRHEETHNGENLKFRCPECPKRFAKKHTRKAHLSTAHFKRGRFVCKVCDKGFHFEFKLKRHEVVHTGVKPYSCELCNRSFNQPGHLKSHMRVHTGERPFMCHECGLCFNHNVSLKNHVQRKHRSASDGDDGYREVWDDITGTGSDGRKNYVL